MPYCRSTYYASATSSTSAPWQLVIPFAVAALLPSLIKSYYVSTLSYEGFAPLWLGIAFRAGLVGNAIFWTLDAADDGTWFPSLPAGTLKSVRVVLAQTIFGLAIVAGSVAFAWAPPCVGIATTPNKPGSAKSATVSILGYANAHGTRYFLFYTAILLAALLVQKPMGAASLSLMTLQILSLLSLLDTASPKLQSSPIGPIALALLASFHFFKTGHQATLASIQWESAFVPLHTIRYPYSPLLIALNTFASHILCALAVPLTVLWKRDPKFAPRSLVHEVARALGWFLLYFAVENLATVMWAGWLRRHLMLYRIFSPRFMAGGAALLIVDVVALLGVGWGSRVNALSVGEVFGWA